MVSQTRASKKRAKAITINDGLEMHQRKVIQCLALGELYSSVARKFDVAYTTVKRFHERHKDEIAALNADLTSQLDAFAIADKVERIAVLDDLLQRERAVIEARATDEEHKDHPGYTTGLLAHTVKAVGSGDSQEIFDEYKVDTALIAEIRNTMRAASEELGQLPKTETTVNLGVFVRQVEGFTGEIG